MVVTANIEGATAGAGGLRPLDPARDMGAVADLIAEAFRDEMDRQGRAAIRELRWMARMSPFVWWWAQTDPSFRETYNGFVWEEPGPRGRRAVVGNANLNRAPGSRQRWVICNVVVRPDQRRRGIARRLMEATMDEARTMGAEAVILQVYQDNWPALHLYTDLGFRQLAGETELVAESVPAAAQVGVPGYEVRPWRPADGQAAYDLALQAIPTAHQWLKPVRSLAYHPDWLTRAGEWLRQSIAGRRAYRLLAQEEPGGQVVALLTVEASYRRGTHRLGLLVHPKHRGPVEEMLVGRALYALAPLAPRGVRTVVDIEYAAAIKALGEHGFRQKRTLLTMGYAF